jgi:hypothetical protein
MTAGGPSGSMHVSDLAWKSNLYSKLYGDEVCYYWISKGQISLLIPHP